MAEQHPAPDVPAEPSTHPNGYEDGVGDITAGVEALPQTVAGAEAHEQSNGTADAPAQGDAPVEPDTRPAVLIIGGLGRSCTASLEVALQC